MLWVFLLVKPQANVCNYSEMIFAQATKTLEEDSEHKKYVLQNAIQASRGKQGGETLLSSYSGHKVKQKSLAFIGTSFSAFKDTKPWGKVMANACVEISVLVQLSSKLLI